MRALVLRRSEVRLPSSPPQTPRQVAFSRPRPLENPLRTRFVLLCATVRAGIAGRYVYVRIGRHTSHAKGRSAPHNLAHARRKSQTEILRCAPPVSHEKFHTRDVFTLLQSSFFPFGRRCRRPRIDKPRIGCIGRAVREPPKNVDLRFVPKAYVADDDIRDVVVGLRLRPTHPVG